MLLFSLLGRNQDGVTRMGAVGLTVTGTGPFEITSAAVTGACSNGRQVTVTWNAAATFKSPISVTTLTPILLLDGGNRSIPLPETLQNSKENETATICVDRQYTADQARILLSPGDRHAFYAVSNPFRLQ